jgi:shikimate kinase
VKPARVLLVGMMGSGKSSIGRALSERTGWVYRDNDELVAELTGVVTAVLLEQRGEAALREAEAQALAKVLTDEPPLVAGIAGGVVESAANRELLAGDDGFVVYLHTAVELLVERVGTGEGRPWLQPDPATALRRLYAGREPRYREVADLVLDTSDGTAAEQADRVVAALARR